MLTPPTAVGARVRSGSRRRAGAPRVDDAGRPSTPVSVDSTERRRSQEHESLKLHARRLVEVQSNEPKEMLDVVLMYAKLVMESSLEAWKFTVLTAAVSCFTGPETVAHAEAMMTAGLVVCMDAAMAAPRMAYRRVVASSPRRARKRRRDASASATRRDRGRKRMGGTMPVGPVE